MGIASAASLLAEAEATYAAIGSHPKAFLPLQLQINLDQTEPDGCFRLPRCRGLRAIICTADDGGASGQVAIAGKVVIPLSMSGCPTGRGW